MQSRKMTLLRLGVASLLCLFGWGATVFAFDGQSLVTGGSASFTSTGPLAEEGAVADGVCVATDCMRPFKARRYNLSGVLQSTLSYVYNQAGQLVKAKNYSTDDPPKLLSNTVYQYDASGRLTKVSYYDGGTLEYYGKSTYNADGRITKGTVYNASDELVYYGVVSYNAKGRISRITAYESDDSLQYVGRVTYNSAGRMTKFSIYDASDTLIAYFTFNYNSSGLMTRETLYLSLPWVGFVKWYYVTFAYKLGACAVGNEDPLFIWGMLATFSELD